MSKKNLFITILVFTITYCNSQPIFKISKDYISTNYDSRVRQIILHYTAGDFQNSLKILKGRTKRKVSSHYLVNNSVTKNHPSYIYNLVPDDLRSWHAGVSEWRRDTDLNNSSIGIEIVNTDGNKKSYPEKQIEAVIFLIKRLLDKYDILPVNIVGHSDIAPGRKIDPGIFFPWKKLFDKGIGAWYDENDVKNYRKKITQLPSTLVIRNYLDLYGYKINNNNNSEIDEEYIDVVKAFQRHFSPNKINGVMSLENYIILRALLKKYNSIE